MGGPFRFSGARKAADRIFFRLALPWAQCYPPLSAACGGGPQGSRPRSLPPRVPVFMTDQSLSQRSRVMLPLLLIGLFVVALTLHGYLSRPGLDRHGDMYENYAWGVLWQWGYFKHPPFFAWETAAWFLVFPKTDFFYYVLAGINAGVALVALWRIAVRFGGPAFQILVLALAMVMPPISFIGLNFNANAAMTPVWALLFLFYLRGIEHGRLGDAVAIGVFGGIAMLTKYHSVVMLAALLIHALTDAPVRRLLLSRFGLVATLSFAAVVTPHLLWLFGNDFLPITYAAHQEDGEGPNLADSLLFLVTPLGYSALSFLIARSMRDLRDRFPVVPVDQVRGLWNRPEGRALVHFAVWPLVLTILLGFVADAQLSAVWGVPFYTAYAVIIALLVPPSYYEPRLRRAIGAILLFCAILVGIAPFWYRYELTLDAGYYNAPLPEIAAEVGHLWQDAGGSPGAVVFGQVALANAISFYSDLGLIALEADSFDVARHYMTPEDAQQRGMIGLCLHGDAACTERVKAIMPAAMQPQNFVVQGRSRLWSFDIWLLKPTH